MFKISPCWQGILLVGAPDGALGMQMYRHPAPGTLRDLRSWVPRWPPVPQEALSIAPSHRVPSMAPGYVLRERCPCPW